MTIQYDEKGKIFTNIVSKDAVPAVIQTLTHRMHGYVYVRQGERIKDELVHSEQFIAVTDATVFNAKGEELYSTRFLLINIEQIVWLIPDEEILGEDRPGGIR